jgi:hypothetical protein
MTDKSDVVTFKDLNAELSRYQKRVSYDSIMQDISTLRPVEKFAIAGMLLESLKVILKGLL